MAFQTLAKTLSLNAQCLRPVFGYKKTPGTVRCRVFSLARLACHPAAGAAHSTWFLLAVGRILLHPLLIALHILWACGCGFFFLCTSSKQSGSDNDGEAKGNMFHNRHYSGRFALVSLMHPTQDEVLSDKDVAIVGIEREVARDQHVCWKHKLRLLF